MGIVRALGLVCRELRDEHGLHPTDIAYHVKRGRKSADRIRRFERGETQPEYLDDLLEAYEKETGVSVAEIVARATMRLNAGEARSAFARALERAPRRNRKPPDGSP